jgi:PKD repeat protein
MTRSWKLFSVVIVALFLSALIAIPASASTSPTDTPLTRSSAVVCVSPPVDIVFSLDSSGSMSGTDPSNIRISGCQDFVNQLDDSKDRAGVVSWSNVIEDIGGDEPDGCLSLTKDFDAVNTALGNVGSGGSGTNLDLGLSRANDLLDDGRDDAMKVMVFLTDGGGTYTSSGNPGSQADRAADAGYVIYTVGLGSGINPIDLEEIADVTGGEYFFASTADDILDVFELLSATILCPPIAAARANPSIGEAPLTVQFYDMSTGDIDEWYWTFGDGSPSDAQYPTHTYQNEGKFQVCLTVEGEGGTDEVCIEVIVESVAAAPNLVVRNLYISATQAQPRQQVAITADVFNEGGAWGDGEMQLLINGQYEQSAQVGVSPGTSQPISFTVYKVPAGEYQVTIGNATGTFYVVEEQQTSQLGSIPMDSGTLIALIVIGVLVIAALIVVIVVLKPS